MLNILYTDYHRLRYVQLLPLTSFDHPGLGKPLPVWQSWGESGGRDTM